MIQEEIYVRSSIDGTMQPSLLYRAASTGKRPLLVGLHTWSYDRNNQIKNMLPYAEKYNFHLLLPEFRGPNLEKNPNCTQACGSVLAKQDIRDAIDYVVNACPVDTDSIFLLGGSGGGHMALMMAGFCPEYFLAIGAFVPITDLQMWSEQSEKYRRHIVRCCGNRVEEMKARSPVHYLDTIAKANVKIFHGKYDPIVPVSHSLNLYQAMMEKYPKSAVYLDIFDGGHELDMEAGMNWLLSQYRKKEKEMLTG